MKQKKNLYNENHQKIKKGKSLTLCGKIVYMVENEGINSKNILGLTFTSKAAKEMRQKLELLCTQNHKLLTSLSAVHLSTFHSFCFK